MFLGPAGNLRFWWSGRPRRPGNPFQKVGREAPHLLELISRPPGLPRSHKSTLSGRPKTMYKKSEHVGKTSIFILCFPVSSLTLTWLFCLVIFFMVVLSLAFSRFWFYSLPSLSLSSLFSDVSGGLVSSFVQLVRTSCRPLDVHSACIHDAES